MTAAHRRRSRADMVLDAVSGVLILLALLASFHVLWTIGGVGLDTVHAQETIAVNAGFDDTKVPEGIARPQEGDPPVDGEPQETQFVGWMYIPRLGADWRRVIQEGTDAVVLDNLGLGHYRNTAMPGGVGNSAYAGHRTPADLGYADRLETGDAIVIQTSEHWYVYTVQSTWVTSASDVSVLDGQGDARILTLTTCDPMYQAPAPNRLIVRAGFSYWADTADGIPAELSDEDATPMRDLTANVTNSIRDISKHVPVTPLFAGLSFALWLVFDGVCWLVFRGERRRKETSWNVLTLMWRLQCGPVALRVLSYALMWLGVMFACWAWLCPWLASWVPWLDTPNPGVV